VVVAVQGAESLHAGFPFVTVAASWYSGAVRLTAVRPSTLFYVCVAVLASAPAWIVEHPPLEDLPFHMATLRAIHSYSDPAYGFGADFFLNLFHTQYALYYVVGSALAYVFGVTGATIALMSAYLGGTVLALRSLLAAIGKDERLTLFVLPLLVNVMFLYGLLPFVCGIPLMLVALAATVRYHERPSRAAGLKLAGIAVALFYAHVVPYALFGVGYAALFPWKRPARWVFAALPVVPSLLAVAGWVALSPQGQESAGALEAAFRHPPYVEAMARLPQWSIDVFRDATDEWYALALAVVVLLSIGLAQGDPDRAKPAARALVVIPIVCLVLYFSTGDMLGDVWLFSQRFPVPAMIAVIPLLRMPRGARGVFVSALALWVGASSIVNVCVHFIRFEREEVGDFDGAIEKMAPRSRVAALIYDKSSSIVNDVPFLHFGSYYQAQKGGVIQFSNSGALYWPVRFRPGHYPPPGARPRLRWEWMPEQVSIQELYPYYDYVLARGRGFSPPPGTFHLAWSGERWSVYARDGR
jgi:hypothetical protein